MTYSLDPKNPISFVQSGFFIFPKQKNLGFKIFQAVASLLMILESK